MENELPGVLNGADEPATVEDLEAVMRRAGQRRRATVMAGATVLLVLGAVGGALARGPVDDNPVGFASSPPLAQQSTTVPPDEVRSSSGGPMGPTVALTPLFRREANGVAIRAYRVSQPMPAPPVPGPAVSQPACAPPASFVQGELSSAAAVTMAGGPDLPGATLAVLGMGEFGREEGAPATWAIVRPGAGMTKVRVTAGAATDVMIPEGGIAVLAVPGDPTGGVVEGLDAKGKVVATQPLTPGPFLVAGPACMPPPCLVGAPQPVTTAQPGVPGPGAGVVEGQASCGFPSTPGMGPATTVAGDPTPPPPFGPKVTSVPVLPNPGASTSPAPSWPTTSTAKPNTAP